MPGRPGADNSPVMATPVRLRVLFFQNLPGNWVARALEHDIASEAPTLASAHRALLRRIRAHVEFDRRHQLPPLSSFPAAPTAYWHAFARGAAIAPGLAQDDGGGSDASAEIVGSVIHEYPAPALRHRILAAGAAR